jgi:hypothetical protein
MDGRRGLISTLSLELTLSLEVPMNDRKLSIVARRRPAERFYEGLLNETR